MPRDFGRRNGGVERDARPVDPDDALLDARSLPEMELDVGRPGGGVGIPERPRLEQRRGGGAGAGQQVSQARKQGAVETLNAVIAVRTGTFGQRAEVDVVLQVRAHPGQVMDDRDAEPAQRVGRADARQQQKARAADGAGGDQHLGGGDVAGDCLAVQRPRRPSPDGSRSRYGAPAPRSGQSGSGGFGAGSR